MIPSLIFEKGGWCPELKKSYRPGFYQPSTREEYIALAKYAVDAQPLPDEPNLDDDEQESDTNASDQDIRDIIAVADLDALKQYALTFGVGRVAHNISPESLRTKILEHLMKPETA